jgi:hypothetical protein
MMVMDTRADRVHHLNATMAAVWTLCDGKRSPERIAECLAETFDCSEVDDVVAAVREALRSLTGLGLLELEGIGPDPG